MEKDKEPYRLEDLSLKEDVDIMIKLQEVLIPLDISFNMD